MSASADFTSLRLAYSLLPLRFSCDHDGVPGADRLALLLGAGLYAGVLAQKIFVDWHDLLTMPVYLVYPFAFEIKALARLQ